MADYIERDKQYGVFHFTRELTQEDINRIGIIEELLELYKIKDVNKIEDLITDGEEYQRNEKIASINVSRELHRIVKEFDTMYKIMEE